MKMTKNPPKGLPSRWWKSSSGRGYYYVVETVGGYRLKSLVWSVRPSEKVWTVRELEESGGRFLKNKPTKAMLTKAKHAKP